MRRFNTIKHEVVLVLKFLDSIDDKWEHYVNVLKNSVKVKTMDLQNLYGNLHNFEERKIFHKEIMKRASRINHLPCSPKSLVLFQTATVTYLIMLLQKKSIMLNKFQPKR